MTAIWFVSLYALLTLAPWAIAMTFGFPLRSAWDELATGLGLTALAILLLEFALSGRFRIISRRVGLDATMRAHQILARFAAAFLLLHPFLYTTPVMNYPFPEDLTRQFTLGLTGPALATGTVAWVLTLVLIFTAIFRDQIGHRYEIWRRAHGLGALLVVSLSIHHAIAAGRYSGEPALAWFWIAALGMACVSLVWVYVARPLRQLRTPYNVASVRKIAHKTWELVVAPVGNHRLAFEAGQFAWLKIGENPFSIAENPFSISSAPADGPKVSFVIKELGDFTSRIGEIKPGTRAFLDGPHGNLTLAGRKGAGIALLAGGVGIAPLIGILRQLAVEKDTRPVTLVYGNRTYDQIVYSDELETLKTILNLKVEHVLSEPPDGWLGRVGQVDPACIRSIFSFDDVRDWVFVLCGPPGMIKSIERTLHEGGVPRNHLISERFTYD
jgi:predicted ferric reductase